LFLGKSTKTAASRAALFDSNMNQIVCRELIALLLISELYLGSLLLKGGEGEGVCPLPWEEKREVGAYDWLKFSCSTMPDAWLVQPIFMSV